MECWILYINEMIHNFIFFKILGKDVMFKWLVWLLLL